MNDKHLVRLARRLRETGVHLMNIMPLIPSGRMKSRRPPTCDELSNARRECEKEIPQFRLCEHCSADVVAFPRCTTECGERADPSRNRG